MSAVHEYEHNLAAASRALRLRWIVCLLGLAGGAIIVAAIFRSVSGALAWCVAAPFLLYIPPIRRRIQPMWAVGQAMNVLARTQGWQYIAVAKPNYMKHFQPAVAKLGLFERQEHIVKGALAGYPFTMYVQTFRQPFAHRYSRNAIRVYCIQLPKELPHIFLRNRQANGIFSTVLRHFDDDQRVDLEGDFDRHFTVYTHRRTVTETLSILAPNVMKTLIDAHTKFDVEVVGNRLYLYTSDYFTTADELRSDMATIQKLMKHLTHRLQSWKFTLPNNRHYPYLQSHAGAATVAIGHTYYNKAWLGIGGYTVYAFARIALMRDMWQAKLAVVVASDIVMTLTLIVFRRKYQLSTRNTRR